MLPRGNERELIRIAHLRLSRDILLIRGTCAQLTFKRALLRVQRSISSGARALETFT